MALANPTPPKNPTRALGVSASVRTSPVDMGFLSSVQPEIVIDQIVGASENARRIENDKSILKVFIEDALVLETKKMYGKSPKGSQLELLGRVMKSADLAFSVLQSRQTESMDIANVEKNGHRVRFLALEKRTEKVRVAAVTHDQFVISHLTAAERTPKVRLASVKAHGQSVYSLNDYQRTPEVCLASVRSNGPSVRYLTPKQRTPAVCLASVKRYGRAVKYLSDAQRTPAVVQASVENSPHAIQFIRGKKRTPGLCLTALQGDINTVKMLDRKDFSKEVCYEVLKQKSQKNELRPFIEVARASLAQILVQEAPKVRAAQKLSA